MDLMSKLAAARSIDHARRALKIADSGQREGALNFVRSLCAMADENPVGAAVSRFGKDSVAARIVKAAVGASSAEDFLAGQNSAGDAFFALVVENSIIGKMSAARQIPFNVRTIVPDENAQGYFVGEHKPIPLSAFSLAGVTLTSKTVAGIIAHAKQLLRTPGAEGRVLGDLVRACSAVLDGAFIDPANTGSDARPAAITAGSGVAVVTGGGNAAADLAELFEAFTGSVADAILVTDPTTSVQAAAFGGSAFERIGAQGGDVWGIPVVVSRNSPRASSGGSWALIDQAGVAYNLAGIEVAKSESATILASDDPENDVSPASVDLFSTDSVAFKATIDCGWLRARPGVVARLDDALYGAS